MLKKFIVGGFLLSVFMTTVFAHEDHDAKPKGDRQQAAIQTVKVADRVYMLVGNGGNIGVSTGVDGVLIVDDQFAASAANIREALKPLGSDKPRFLINTHWHGDHTGGNEIFGEFATIISQINVRRRLSTESTVRGRAFKPLAKIGLPLITFESSLSVHFNAEEIRVVHFPSGHTDGDGVIFFTNSNVVHMGDNFFRDRFPFVDMESGGSVQGLTKNIADIIALLRADVKIIPGHGPLSTITDLKNYHQMLVETTDTVRKGMAAGKNLETLKKEGFPAKYKDWGTGFIKTDAWVETIYRSFSAK
jgi:glyoxylase-like metal-dependent hydrolase (beta-lactamase superfamily II)